MSKSGEPLILRILRAIGESGHLSPENVSQKLSVSKNTVYPLISHLRALGLISYYVDEDKQEWSGKRSIYVVSEVGKIVLTARAS